MNRSRVLLSGAVNVRDIGGYPTATGRQVLRGRLLRGDALASLTDHDVTLVARLGLRTVIDFRTPGEILLGGSDRLPPHVAAVNLPIRGGDMATVHELITSGDPERQRQLLGAGQAERFMMDVNRGFVADPRQRERFAVALRYVAAGLPALYHCTSGKDRTAWMTAIVLTALGVRRSDVLDDYLFSNECLRGSNEKLLEDIAAAGLMREPELLRPVLEQRPEYLAAAFDEAERRYGSFDTFLVVGLGVDEATLAALRGGLLT